MKSTGTQSFNELQWLYQMIGYQFSNSCSGYQGDKSYLKSMQKVPDI